MIDLNDADDESEFLKALKRTIFEINQDQYMIMEYLGPVVDGCRAALNVNIKDATSLDEITDTQFEKFMEETSESFSDITIRMNDIDTNEVLTLSFVDGQVEFDDETEEPNVYILASTNVMLTILDADPRASLVDLLSGSLEIIAHDSQDAIEAIGFLCFPALQRAASLGIDPSNLESEDADSIITSTATELVTSALKQWIDVQINHASP